MTYCSGEEMLGTNCVQMTLPTDGWSLRKSGGWAMNKATKLNVGVLGIIFGISGMNHGFFEVLQGNTSTPNLFIFAIGEAQKMWIHGNEPALTLIPNFLLSGIVAMVIGLAIVVWSLGFVHRKHGSIILFSLFVLLLLLGGGVAQILFFPWICLVACPGSRYSPTFSSVGS
jgi:hypothetical protein